MRLIQLLLLHATALVALVQGLAVSSRPFCLGTADRATSFALASPTTVGSRLYAADPDKVLEAEKEKGIFDFIFNPYESKIPKEIEKDIYAAEANTEAAKLRGQRIGLYAAAAFTGILFAFFNGFLTELRNGSALGDVPIDLDDVGFGWVTSNFLSKFLFTNKIGGIICLLSGGACGLLAESEYDTRRINAEQIFDEMQRRRAEKEGGGAKKQKDPKKRQKRRSGKETKRMGALSEVVLVATNEPTTAHPTNEPPVGQDEVTEEVKPNEGKIIDKQASTKEEGLLGSIKGFYEKADSMAATQALLLNKKLEDEGLIEKITDETGFKIIGKDAASKLKEGLEKEKQQ